MLRHPAPILAFTAATLVSACGAAPSAKSPAAARTACEAGAVGPPCALIGTAPEPWRQPDLTGAMQSVPPTRGRPAIVDFWSVDCAPCKRAMPALSALHTERGVPVVGVSLDTNPGRVLSIARDLGVSYPIIIDDQRAVAGRYKIGADVPRLFVVDAHGTVRAVFDGADDAVTRAAAVWETLSRGGE